MDNINIGHEYACSECGRVFTVRDNGSYKYKMAKGNRKHDHPEFRAFQCGYTCYDHALLRMSRQGHVSNENFNKYVINSERTMKGQGKEILHPIPLKSCK